jgi:hypothetical protein
LRRNGRGYLGGDDRPGSDDVGDGIETLRDKRGDERVTFADVCDHLVDFARRSPEHAPAVDAFAAFLANVEDVDHAHRDGRPGTLDRASARDVRA